MSDIPENTKVFRRLAAILAADVAGYSALMGVDEARTVRDLKAHQAIVLPMIAEHGGRVIDTAGDGILAEFSSVVNAVECAVAIQRVMVLRNADFPLDRQMKFRIGVNLGDVIYDDARVYGDGVNVAARLESIAEPGGICVSGAVREQVQKKVQLTFVDLGEQSVKNISDPVRVYRINVGNSSATSSAKPALSEPDKPSIAVLPFTNMSGDPDQEFFGDGIAEDILTGLSKLRWLFVIARNSSFTYKGKAVDIKQVSRELGVRYVLEGSLRKSGSRVRVTGQLIDANTGTHVWAERYDRSLEDIFAVQDEITSAVAKAIGPAIVEAEQKRAMRKPPESLGAWEAYQRGMLHLRKPAEGDEARRCFKRAMEVDPYYSPAYSGMAVIVGMDASVYKISWEECFRTAEPLARQAIRLDEGDAEAHARLALIMLFAKGAHEEAIHSADAALAISPNCAEAYGVKGAALVFHGRRAEGRDALNQCFSLDPRDPARPFRLGQFAASQYLDEDYAGCIRTTRQLLHDFPEFGVGFSWLAASLGQLGRIAEDQEVISAFVSQFPLAVDAQIRSRHPVISVSDHNQLLDGLRKAGWKG
jgi:adenylate cyclase